MDLSTPFSHRIIGFILLNLFELLGAYVISLSFGTDFFGDINSQAFDCHITFLLFAKSDGNSLMLIDGNDWVQSSSNRQMTNLSHNKHFHNLKV